MESKYFKCLFIKHNKCHNNMIRTIFLFKKLPKSGI